MKKKISFLTGVLLLLFSINVYATTKAEVNLKVNGEYKEGNTVDLIIEVKDVDRLYGGQMDFSYDTEYIKINSIEKGEFFNTVEDQPFDGAETDKGGGHAQIFFSFMGDNYGLKGSGELIKINLTVLKNGKLTIDDNNMVIKLIEREADKDPGYMTFNRNNISLGEGESIPSQPLNNNNSVTNDENNNTDNNSEDSNSNNQDEKKEEENLNPSESDNKGENNLDSSEAESDKQVDKQNSSSTAKTLGIIGGLVAIVVIIGVIVYSKRKKYNKQ